MEQARYVFVDRTGLPAEPPTLGSPVLIPKEALEAEADRLARLPAPANGRRMSLIVNPESGAGHGLTCGTGVALCVLKPGERTAPVRHNSSQVNFCIGGAGRSIVGGREVAFQQYDIWNTPPWTVYEHVNDTSDLQVRLTYSNAPLLEKLNVHITEENPTLRPPAEALDGFAGHPEGAKHPFGTFELGNSGAFLMPYETLVSPPVHDFPPLHWPWQQVKHHLDKLAALGQSYVGRRLYLLYHPATGRTNGTTANFFATITIRPGGITDKPHRHVASAINYIFNGKGRSNVGGKLYLWKAGDLMLTAPGWAIHNHSADEDVYELTIQDSPLHICMGSLMWQEDLAHPPESLGLSGGFETNRAAQAAAR